MSREIKFRCLMVPLMTVRKVVRAFGGPRKKVVQAHAQLRPEVGYL